MQNHQNVPREFFAKFLSWKFTAFAIKLIVKSNSSGIHPLQNHQYMPREFFAKVLLLKIPALVNKLTTKSNSYVRCKITKSWPDSCKNYFVENLQLLLINSPPKAIFASVAKSPKCDQLNSCKSTFVENLQHWSLSSTPKAIQTSVAKSPKCDELLFSKK